VIAAESAPHPLVVRKGLGKVAMFVRAPQWIVLLAALAGPGSALAQNQQPRSSTTCDIRASGAANDGTTDNTAAIQAAIESCAGQGGGIVLVDGGGTYVTGPLHLESHVFLKIVAPAVLKNTVDHALYQPAFIGYPFQFANDPSVTGVGPSLPGHPEAMISGNGLTDTGVIGDGTIDGSGADSPPASIDNGQSWLAMAKAAKSLTDYSRASFQDNAVLGATSYASQSYPDIPTTNGLPRPWFVEFYNCMNVSIGSVLLTNSPMWDLVLRYDTNVEVTGLRVLNDPTAPNTDGIDPVGSQKLRFSNLAISTGDDDIAIKSGLPGIPSGVYYQPPYNLPRLPTSDLTVENSTFGRGGGLAIGSETVNGIQHIRARNIQFLGTGDGIHLKTGRDRGNQIFDIVISDLQMTDVGTPLLLSEYYPTIPGPTQGDIAQPEPANTRPYVHDITISNVQANNPGTVLNQITGPSQIIGIPESPIYNLTLENIMLNSSAPNYIRLRNVNGLTCRNVGVAPVSVTTPSQGHVFDNESGLQNINGCDVSPMVIAPEGNAGTPGE
jgi:polygalacturonase